MKALLIRHATSAGQEVNAPLSKDGYAQAQALAPVLQALGAGPLYASPYRRAQETIAPYAEMNGQVVTLLDGLRERTLSPVKLPDWQDHIRHSFVDANHAPNGGESHHDLRLRAAEALQTIEMRGGDLPAFVTHGGLTSALFSATTAEFGFDDWQSLRNPDLFEVVIEAGRIKTFNRYVLEAGG